VAPQAELATREKAELAARKDVQELAPLRSEYLQVNYAKAQDMAALIKTQTNSLMSTRGSVAVDDRTNTLLLQDTADRLADVRRLVATLDIPVRQVLIEARVVIVSNDFERDLGARFGLTNWQKNGQNGLVSTSGTAAGTDSMTNTFLTGQNAINTALNQNAFNASLVPPGAPVLVPGPTYGIPAAASRYNINLPVASPAVRSPSASSAAFPRRPGAVGCPGGDAANIISSPRVITANQKEATIEQGVEIPTSSPPPVARPPSSSRRRCC